MRIKSYLDLATGFTTTSDDNRVSDLFCVKNEGIIGKIVGLIYGRRV